MPKPFSALCRTGQAGEDQRKKNGAGVIQVLRQPKNPASWNVAAEVDGHEESRDAWGRQKNGTGWTDYRIITT